MREEYGSLSKAGEKNEKWATILSKVVETSEASGREGAMRAGEKIRDRFWTLSKVGGKKAHTTLAGRRMNENTRCTSGRKFSPFEMVQRIA